MKARVHSPSAIAARVAAAAAAVAVAAAVVPLICFTCSVATLKTLCSQRNRNETKRN